MKISSIALGLLVSLSVCSAHIGGQLRMQELNPHVYCGRILARALAELCSFQRAEKRSGTTPNAIITSYEKEQELQNLWPWLTPHKARALAPTSRGKRFRGVVDECCVKPCTIDEMLSYCGN